MKSKGNFKMRQPKKHEPIFQSNKILKKYICIKNQKMFVGKIRQEEGSILRKSSYLKK